MASHKKSNVCYPFLLLLASVPAFAANDTTPLKREVAIKPGFGHSILSIILILFLTAVGLA